MIRPRLTVFALLLLPLWLAGCADERAAGTPIPAPYPLAPYGVPLAAGPLAPMG